ncbi:uncharacterized protein K489DRAFT_429695 [Dissoconium aciculare CBS 342.82]|uniref:Uncharacterized protein n=1 Tax=Dissoconium aciculare CBS 342.82 TaxID=1314786 RepID=A0A6J3MBN7_9PEZI|nr:uncharacterized protein K489DRAFT_429695 [Dissoconium aciculare CBS 342.82]KAF1825431.1 hypothetical protein K489DRAFT_429695 [Dissoconium aciculare CBS 342.82]
MSDSGSEADSRADTVGRKRKRVTGVDYSNVTTSIQISDTEDTDTSRPSSRRNSENHVVYGYKDSPTNAPLEGRPPSPGLSIEGGEVAASTPRSKESGELSSDDEDSPSDLCSPGESSGEETSSHVGDDSDDDSRDGGSDRSPSSTGMSISSGDDYEPLGTADNHSDRTDLRLQDVTESEQSLHARHANHFIVAKSDLQSKDGVETGDQGIEDTVDDGYGWQMKLLDSLLDDERG